ncbi:MAG: Hint domain-containing protein, partial [Roseomonas sp.]|nr:Hint domain-containing protein [Roseomonas sp.]
GNGSDTLSGGGGNDWLDFGGGVDRYSFLTTDIPFRGSQTLIGDGDNIFGNGIGNDTLDLGVGWSSGETASGWINYQHVAGGVTTNLWTQGWEQVVCFAAGTRIVTPNGEDAVENLRAGDMVLAMRNGQAGFEPLRWVGFMDIAVPRNAAMAAKTAPILIKAGAIAPGMPARDLRVSPDHAREIDGHLIPAKHLVNGSSIVQEVWCRRVRYFHLELEAHGLLLSEGTWSESYLDDGNRHAFNNVALTGLFLDFEAGRAKGEYDHLACLPVLRQGLKLDEIHGRIALRAQELAQAKKGRSLG